MTASSGGGSGQFHRVSVAFSLCLAPRVLRCSAGLILQDRIKGNFLHSCLPPGHDLSQPHFKLLVHQLDPLINVFKVFLVILFYIKICLKINVGHVWTPCLVIHCVNSFYYLLGGKDWALLINHPFKDFSIYLCDISKRNDSFNIS